MRPTSMGPVALGGRPRRGWSQALRLREASLNRLSSEGLVSTAAPQRPVLDAGTSKSLAVCGRWWSNGSGGSGAPLRTVVGE